MASASFVTDLTEIATQAAEAAAGIAGIINAFKILDLQRKYYNLYRQQREFYYDVFQQGVERPLAEETYTELPYEYNYIARLNELYDSTFGPLASPQTDMQGWWERHAAYYGASLDGNMLLELPFELARIKSDWMNYMMRYEEHYYDVVNDRRWQRRFAVHNIGIKQGTAIAAALDNSLAAYTDHLHDFGNQLATYGNGAARYVGYKKGLADTADDFSAMSYSPQAAEPSPYKTLGPYKPLAKAA
jgi:hypothetical protein